MPNDYFQFKGFTIYQDRTAMKVGTDGVLLGAWANAGHAARILDVGTGTGLLALMMAQRSDATITALEVDQDAFRQAKENIEQSGWNSRIRVLHQSFQAYCAKTGSLFDLVVSNPPYFHQSLKSSGRQRNRARHTHSLPYRDLLAGARCLLTRKGLLSLIFPAATAKDFIALAESSGLYLVRRTTVYPHTRKNAHRMLMEFGLTPTTPSEDTLTIEEDRRHHFTDQYKSLTKDFYLHF